MNNEFESKFVEIELTNNDDSNSIVKIEYGWYDKKLNKFEYIIENVIAILLLDEKVFTNSFYFMKDWPQDAKNKTAFEVNCSDIFAWGCADSEPIDYSEIIDLFECYLKDPNNGCDIWCIKKRNIFPQKPVYEYLIKKHDLDNMGLDPNPTW
jgi:hypothetical protein